MPTEAELFQKLRNADAAGDKVAAKRFADMIREQRAKSSKSTPEPAAIPVPLAAPEGRSQLEDIGVGIVSGINRGAAAIPGIPGTIQSLARQADTALGLKGPQFPTLPTSEDTIAAWEDFSGKLPEPDTAVGRYAQSASEFLPGGPASIPRKLATAGLLGGATQAGQDIGGDPGALAGLGAGLLTGKVTGLTSAPTLLGTAKKAKNVPETAEEARKLRNEGYDVLKADKTTFDPTAYNEAFIEGIRKLREEGRTIQNTPELKTFIRQHASKGKPPRAIEIEVARQDANTLSSAKGGGGRVGTVMKEELDKIEKGLLGADLNKALDKGRVQARATHLGDKLENIIERGEGAEDVQSSLRTQMRTYGANAKKKLPTEVNQAVKEFLSKPVGRRLLKMTSGVLRGPWTPSVGAVASFISGDMTGLAGGVGAKLLGEGIKYGQEMSALNRANLVKKIALMSPDQRAELSRRLAAAKSQQNRVTVGTGLLGLGAPLEGEQ